MEEDWIDRIEREADERAKDADDWYDRLSDDEVEAYLDRRASWVK